jgi:hypothetical protein
LLTCQIKKIDEFKYFGGIMKKLYQENTENMKLTINMLQANQQQYLKTILQSKRITIMNKGVSTCIARKFVKAKRPQGAQPPPQPPQPSINPEGNKNNNTTPFTTHQ